MTVQRSVPFFDYPRVFTDDEEALTRIFKDVGSRGAFIMQKDLRDFEAQLARFTGSENAIGVANATDGLELAWMSVGLQPGDEVIISAHTMLATASSVVIAGGTPVPVDIGDDNLIDPSAIAAAIGPRTVGVMPTQLNGRTCNMTPILDLVQRSGLVLVEDSAQALGSRRRAACGDFRPRRLASSCEYLAVWVMVARSSRTPLRLRTRSTNSMTTAGIKMAIRLAGVEIAVWITFKRLSSRIGLAATRTLLLDAVKSQLLTKSGWGISNNFNCLLRQQMVHISMSTRTMNCRPTTETLCSSTFEPAALAP